MKHSIGLQVTIKRGGGGGIGAHKRENMQASFNFDALTLLRRLSKVESSSKLATEASKALPETTSRDEKHSNDAKRRLDKICEELEFNKTTQDVVEICNVLPQG